MSKFLILIDDRELIAPDASTAYPCMDAAVDATVQAAVSIAQERAKLNGCVQRLTCEVQEHGTSQRREFDVLLRVGLTQ